MLELAATGHGPSDQLLCRKTSSVGTQAAGGTAVEEHIPASFNNLPFFTMVDGRKRLHREVIDNLALGART
jgi:hypothetical protein